MSEELYSVVAEFVEEWEELAKNTSTAFSIQKEELAGRRSVFLLNDVERLADHLEAGAVTFSIESDNDRYRIRYNPTNGSIQSERRQGTEYDIDKIYRGEMELVNVLEQIEDNLISNSSQVRDALGKIHQADQLRVKGQYSLRKSNVEDAIRQIIDAKDIGIHFYFDWESLKKRIENIPPASIRTELLEDNQYRSLIVVLSLSDFIYGNALGVSGLSVVSSLNDFLNDPVKWRAEMEDIRRNTLIQQPDDLFLPPSFFRFSESSDDNLAARTQGLFNGYLSLFALLSIVNSAEHRDRENWHVRLQGRQFIEGNIDTSSKNKFIVQSSDNDEVKIDVTEEIASDLYSLYLWAYKDDIENRITVVRNVATLYARNIHEVITDASKIQNSAESNRRYYIRESIDEFFEFRQDLTESAFQTRREFANLRSDLMNDLSRDIFRTFGFIIAIVASAFFRLDNIFPPVLTYGSVAALIYGYAIVTLRRVRGIRTQFVSILKNQEDYVEFYSNFFDDDELERLGLNSDGTCPQWCRPFRWWWKRKEAVREPIDLWCAFALDLWIYYVLIFIVGVLATGMIAEAIDFIDLVEQIP